MQIGEKDKDGNLLLLGGRNADLLMTPGRAFLVGEKVTLLEKEAMETYNQINTSTWPSDYISRWLENNGSRIIGKVESISRPGLFHYQWEHKDGNTTCTCEGFIVYGSCSHLYPIALRKYKERAGVV